MSASVEALVLVLVVVVVALLCLIGAIVERRQRRKLQVLLEESVSQKESLEREIVHVKEERDLHEERSLKDPLMGIPNRRGISPYLEYELAKIGRYGGILSVMFIDIDRFKLVNDTRGHPFGDQLLQSLGDVFSRSIRGTDLVARYGGDEFLVLMPGTDQQGSDHKAELVLGLVKRVGEDCGAEISASIGLVTVEGGPAVTLDEIIGLADKQLYEAKRGGGNRYSRA